MKAIVGSFPRRLQLATERADEEIPSVLSGEDPKKIGADLQARKAIEPMTPATDNTQEGVKSVTGILTVNGSSIPGAVLVPHRPGGSGYPHTDYRKLQVVGEMDFKNGVIHLKRPDTNEVIRFQFDAKNPPDFVLKMKAGMELDVLHGGGGFWKSGSEKLLERASSKKLTLDQQQDAQRQLIELAKKSPNQFSSAVLDQLLTRGTQGEQWVVQVIEPLLQAEAAKPNAPQIVTEKLRQGVMSRDAQIQQSAFSFLLKMKGEAATILLKSGFEAAQKYLNEAWQTGNYRQSAHEINERKRVFDEMKINYNLLVLQTESMPSSDSYYISSANPRGGKFEGYIALSAGAVLQGDPSSQWKGWTVKKMKTGVYIDRIYHGNFITVVSPDGKRTLALKTRETLPFKVNDKIDLDPSGAKGY